MLMSGAGHDAMAMSHLTKVIDFETQHLSIYNVYFIFLLKLVRIRLVLRVTEKFKTLVVEFQAARDL